MSHVQGELLAGHALGELDVLSEADRDHLAGCPQCRAELDELNDVVAAAADKDVAQSLSAPGPDVWRRIEAELAGDAQASGPQVAVIQVAAPQRSATPVLATPVSTADDELGNVRTLPARARRPRWPLALVAAALGLVVGIGMGAFVERDRVEAATVLWQTPLKPLPGKSGTGTATVVQTDGMKELRVKVKAADLGAEDHQVWLINTADHKRMIPIGHLPASGQGSWPIPPTLKPKLDEYTIVDVSIEPNDGDARHSGDSLVRGVLPQN